MPFDNAPSTMKLIGIKIPKKNTKEDRATMVNLRSLNGSTKIFNSKARGFGGSRDLMVKKAMVINPRIIKAMVRLEELAKECTWDVVIFRSKMQVDRGHLQSPPKTDLGNKMRRHNGKNNTAKAAARCHSSKSSIVVL